MRTLATALVSIALLHPACLFAQADQGKIAFRATDRSNPGDRAAYTIRPDGSNRTRLPTGPRDLWVSWSPDGKRVALLAATEDDEALLMEHALDFHFMIHVMDADGSNRRRVSDVPGQLHWWSPDGMRLVLTSGFEDERNRNTECCRSTAVYVITVDGGELTRVTEVGSTNTFPSWSPDGTRVAFSSDREWERGTNRSRVSGTWQIYVANADGSGERRLLDHPDDDLGPVWSPDGTRIVFTARPVPHVPSETRSRVMVVNADGSGLQELVEELNAGNPVWSPTGESMLLTGYDEDIYLVDLETGSVRNLTESPGREVEAVFSPDGSRVAFTSNRSGTQDIYVVNVDGSGLTRLTNDASHENELAWVRDPGRKE
ncbi:MAG: DPP IV N-terminal domain-containing protein [Gemmatimonadales bacterium]